MHEMSLAENILEIIEETIPDSGEKKLLSVTVEVGKLAAVMPDSLQFCFETIIEDTPFRGARLQIVEKPLSGYCPACQISFEIDNMLFSCPRCDSIEIRINGGQELQLTELEVE